VWDQARKLRTAVAHEASTGFFVAPLLRMTFPAIKPPDMGHPPSTPNPSELDLGELCFLGDVGGAFEMEAVAVGVGEHGIPEAIADLRFRCFDAA